MSDQMEREISKDGIKAIEALFADVSELKSREIPDGIFHPDSLADASAPNNSIYYSTTQAKLVYKDSGGVVHTLY